MKQENYLSSELSTILTQAMEKKNVSIKDLAEQCDIVYEHCRRIVRGMPPSRPVLRVICKVLDLNFKQLDELSTAASIKRKYGDVPEMMAGKNPELGPIEHAWDKLTDEQKQSATSMITGWAKSNRVSA